MFSFHTPNNKSYESSLNKLIFELKVDIPQFLNNLKEKILPLKSRELPDVFNKLQFHYLQ